MSTKVLMKCAKKGINLSPEAYEVVLNEPDPFDFISSVIVKLKGDNYSSKDLISVNKETIVNIKNQLKTSISSVSHSEKEINTDTSKPESVNEINQTTNSTISTETSNILEQNENNNEKSLQTPNTTISTEKPETIINTKKEEPKVEKYKNKIIEKSSQEVKDEKVKFKRNLTKTNVEYDFKVLQDTSKKSYTSGEIENLISYFQSRYEKLAKILSKRPELKTYQKIADIEEGQTNLSLILMVKEIRTTKNGHKLVEFEDDTGSIPILFSNKNEELFKEAEKLVKDEVVGVIADKNGDLAIGNQIIDPGVTRIAQKEMDFGIVFLSDVHIGSLTFLEDAFNRFIDWINCEFGSEEQREIANDVKYLVIGGDIVDGIGVYPNQEKELAIKDITQQYNEAAKFLGKIRSDIKIIIAPGNHDASRVAEPQPAVPEEYAKALYELDNVEFISNPGVVSLDGINVLIYHGRSFDDLVMAVKDFTHERNDLLMEELLKKRHLAPIYGERTPLASELEDYLVIDEIPDVFHTGHVHINTYRKFNGIHLINSGTFQTQTEFQKIYNIEPTPAEVPILHKGKYKHLKFA